MSTVPPPDRPDDDPAPSLSDEQLESFLREATEGGGAAVPKEPSARARMVARRLREEDEAARRAQGGRKRGEQGPPHASPPGWRTGPATRLGNGGSRRRRVGAVVGVLVLALLAVVAVRPSLVTDLFPGGEDGSDGPLAAESAQPTGAPADPARSGRATREHPFRGSPAEQWAEGADAIEVPEAKALSGMSEKDVAFALRRTKDLLVAANLDPAVLRGEWPEEALAVLDPKQPELLPRLRRSLREPDEDHDPLRMFTRFDPDEVRLAGDVVKVRGRMELSAGEKGVVKVDADYTFVYPLVRAQGDDGRVARTIVRRVLTLTLNDPARWNVTEGRLLVEKYFSEHGNTACGVDDGYLHPGFGDDAAGGDPATGPLTDPYDRSKPLTGTESEECGKVTRT
ncbi:hypothetical protein J2S54_002772 [Streptomyces sp. DSM 42143]|uniref:hypothetical protein n=1 Tax=unclassified Streptomyces TaxID=2593676 RepID=UPI0025B029FF|nr:MULTISPECIES: hypothetical protein [unclassified Streptomyces]MDN3246092.1 hypothetical protein [Streptomyces sp. ZSW22]MDQ0385952.1 hypothetical protein [Streptomyces sp. DSM 42143]